MNQQKNKVRFRTYDKETSAAFLKTRGKWGELSNMCAGFPISINGLELLGTEALYQSLRFTEHPEIQKLIFEQENLYFSKKCCQTFVEKSRKYWMKERIQFMRWCLQLKIAQHWDVIVPILNESKGMPIVEISKHDNFWGAKLQEDGSLYGMNVLGRLWMEQREIVFNNSFKSFEKILPPDLEGLMILGKPALGCLSKKPREACDQLGFF
ncbi:NADAR family protein [Vibrio metschnikovii]|uniref:NADAR family protein n=1 Tax=Vibrio metschnikovii TaxID=28172 RepID=A0A9X0R899_VIBME|nr:NADAR family protein [Vibrio metschnikovii]MBC5851452.1 NADAR family protein [Vibrio metschnikovii]